MVILVGDCYYIVVVLAARWVVWAAAIGMVRWCGMCSCEGGTNLACAAARCAVMWGMWL